MEGTQTETKPRGENKPRGPRNDNRQDRPRTGRDGEKREKGDRPQREKRERVQREKVTLETEIPALPDKKDRIAEPKQENFTKSLNDFDKQIDDLFKGLKKFVDETIKAAKSEREANKDDKTPAFTNLQDKIAESKTLNQEFKTIRNEFQQKKAVYDEISDKINKLKEKLKGRNSFNKESMEAELKQLTTEQSQGTISLMREKEIIKDIAVLKKLIPLVAPLDALNTQLKEVKAEKDALGKKQNAAWAKSDVINSEIKEHKEALDLLKQSKTESKGEKGATNTVLDERRAEVYKQVDEIKAQKKKFKEDFFVQKDKYYEQQDLIQRVDFMKKIKERLVKDQERQQEYEKRKKEREEEEKLIDESPYKEETDLCQLLIDYCEKLDPSRKVVSTDQVQEVQKVDLDNVLKSNEWKKDNCTAVVSNKDVNNDFFAGAPKGKKHKRANKQQQANTEQVVVETKLNHQMEVLSYFNEMRTPAPVYLKDIDATVKQLQERKTYYETLPKDAKKEQNNNQSSSNNEERAQKKKTQNKKEFTDSEFPTL